MKEPNAGGLKLICGDPNNGKAASYSRFVIPFAYRLKERSNANAKTSSYRDVTEKLQGLDWRKKYLTRETEKVLFESARWFRLETNNKNGIPTQIDFHLNNTISASVTAPQLVLFEFPTGKESKGLDSEEWDILQVGFLIFEVYFKEDADYKPTLDDLITINELFRYFDEPFEGHYKNKKLDKFLDKDSLKELRFGNEDEKVEVSLYKRWFRLLDDLQISDKWVIKYADATNSADEENPKNTYPDNRAFTWTCAILPNGAKDLWQAFPFAGWKASGYGHWIKLLNVDTPETTPEETHKTREFEREWADKHTYHRWEEKGTYYGFTSHNGAVIASSQNDDPPIWQHFGQMYFDQVLLLLYLRVVLFRFSGRLGAISRKARDNSNGAKDTWAKAFQELRWQFALFTNLYQFPLLSNQEQGIELYILARRCMEVDDLFEEVQQEIHSSHDYLSQQQNREQTRITTKLTKIAAFVSALALAIALFSMSMFVESPWIQWCTTTFGRFKTFLLTGLLLLAIVWLFLRKKKD